MIDYQRLNVWQRAHNLAVAIYSETGGFPREHRFRLTDQLRRAASSIGANIAEGAALHSKKEFRRFLSIASGSAAELSSHVQLARDIDLMTPELSQRLLVEIDEIGRMLSGLSRRISRQIDL